MGQGYRWVGSNSLEILVKQREDWSDFLFNDTTQTGAVRISSREGYRSTFTLSNEDLGNRVVVLSQAGDEIAIDIDDNDPSIAHLKIVSNGETTISEESGFRDTFGLTLQSVITPEGDELLSSEDQDQIAGDAIPPFNLGDVLLVSMIIALAIFLTAWIVRKGGATSG